MQMKALVLQALAIMEEFTDSDPWYCTRLQKQDRGLLQIDHWMLFVV